MIDQKIIELMDKYSRKQMRQEKRVEDHFRDIDNLSRWGMRDRGYCEGIASAYEFILMDLEKLLKEI